MNPAWGVLLSPVLSFSYPWPGYTALCLLCFANDRVGWFQKKNLSPLFMYLVFICVRAFKSDLLVSTAIPPQWDNFYLGQRRWLVFMSLVSEIIYRSGAGCVSTHPYLFVEESFKNTIRWGRSSSVGSVFGSLSSVMQHSRFNPPLSLWQRGFFPQSLHGLWIHSPKTILDESVNCGLVCAHMHSIAWAQKILTFMS